MPNIHKTEIVIILDRSGSMANIREDMEGGFKTFVDGQRKEPGDCTLSLYQFDDRFDVVYEAKRISDVTQLELEPRGSTALLDAIGKTLAFVAARHDELAEADKPAAVIVLVITDGRENASVEWRIAGVRKAVQNAETVRNWRFVFLGADTSAFCDATSMGIGTSASYVASPQGVRTLYAELGSVSRSYRGRVREGDLRARPEIKRTLTEEIDPEPEKH